MVLGAHVCTNTDPLTKNEPLLSFMNLAVEQPDAIKAGDTMTSNGSKCSKVLEVRDSCPPVWMTRLFTALHARYETQDPNLLSAATSGPTVEA